MIETQFNHTVKILWSDNAQEYNDKSFLSFLDSKGTLLYWSCPYTSQQNGCAERKHHHILDVVRILLISAFIPECFWGEAALTVVYTINCVPSPTIHNKSPFELHYGQTPNYSSLRVFGCACFVSLPLHERTKLQPRAHLCCFLGYGESQKGFCCYDPITHRLCVSCHVKFWEHLHFTSLQQFSVSSSSESPIFTNIFLPLYPEFMEDSSTSAVSPDDSSLVLSLAHDLPILDPVASPSPEPLVGLDLRRSTWVSVPPPYLTNYQYSFALVTLYEPHTYCEAHTDLLWQQTMSEELDALHKNHTWKMVDLPPSQFVVGYRWVCNIKTKEDGFVKRYKAHLVAKGFTQEYGIDYEVTFALVACLTSVRCVIIVVAVCHQPLYQMDVMNAFLNGDLQEEVYMQPPPDYIHLSHQVCRLRHALYGLKQAPRIWFENFSLVVAQQGFTLSPYDTAFFVRRSSIGITLILLYVDDMILTRDDSTGIHFLQHFLSQHFEMKDLGTLSYFLGLEITSSSDGYYLSQATYTFDLLSKAGITNNKTVFTSLEYNAKLTPLDSKPISNATRYCQLVGSLIYLTVTRPNISHVVSMVSKFTDAPCSVHYATVLQILRYVKGTLYHGFHYSSRASCLFRCRLGR